MRRVKETRPITDLTGPRPFIDLTHLDDKPKAKPKTTELVANMDHIIFKSSNKKELATIYDELVLLDKADFEKLLRYVFAEKFNFLYINTNEEFDSQYHKNFNKLRLKNLTMM